MSVTTDAIAAFLESICGDEGLIEVRSKLNTGSTETGFYESAEDAAQAAEEFASDPRRRVWFGVAPRVPGTTRGRAEDCYTPRVFFADIDEFPTWEQGMIDDLLRDAHLPPPSIVVASGGGHHLYWLYDGHLSKNVWQTRERGLVKILASLSQRSGLPMKVDATCHDIPRVFQIPHIPNTKYDPPRMAKVLDDVGTGEVYDRDAFAPTTEEGSSRAEWWDFELPAYTDKGQRDEHIRFFACRRLVRDDASYHQVLSEARQHFCNSETCYGPCEWDDVRTKIDRQHRYNKENRRRFEAERRANQAAAPPPEDDDIVRPEEIIANVVATIRSRAYMVHGIGPLVYNEAQSRYVGNPWFESAVSVAIGTMARQDRERAAQILSHQYGSRFSRIVGGVMSSLECLSTQDVSTERGVIPMSGGAVLSLEAGEIEDRSSDPPFFNWTTNADPATTAESIERRQYGAWGEFIESSFERQSEREYMQRLAYYIGLGCNPDRVFVLAHGPTSSGKSLFFEKLAEALMGEAISMDRELVCKTRGLLDQTEYIQLSGKRLVFCDEINRGDHLDTSRVKNLCSPVGRTARGAYQKSPCRVAHTFVLALITNYLPELSEPDEALMNRLHFVSFRVSRRRSDRSWRENDDRPPMDPTLRQRIKPEEVLAWVVDGRALYERDHLTPPPSFLADAQAWFRKVDAVGAWADDMLEEDTTFSSRKKFSDLHKDFARDMHSGINLPEFKDRLRDWIDRQGWCTKDCRVENTAGLKGVIYKGGQIV